MVSLFPLLVLIGYGSTSCTVCSQHNGMIYKKLKKVNIDPTRFVNMIADVKLWNARTN